MTGAGWKGAVEFFITWHMNGRLLLPLLLCLLATATGFVQRFAGGFRPADIPEMVFLQPAGAIGVIGRGNRNTPNPDASADASDALRQALLRHDEKLRLKSQLLVKDSLLRQAVLRLAFRGSRELESYRKRPFSMPTPWLDSLLATQKQRYCLVSFVQGYTRTPGNNRGRIAKDLGIGLLSMGMVIPLSSQASTRVGVFIYDAQQHAVVYYKASIPAEKDPLAGVVIDRELTDLLTNDFNLTDRI
ncbi:MAG: hypothetical protein JWP58_281 [Hymenobacter sp.]|nr:hypothetical protein [Hymenobacter sp.]